jgi:hypothetical protein
VVGRSMGNKETGLLGVNDVKEALGAQGIQVKTFEPSAQAKNELATRLEKFKIETGNTDAQFLPDEWLVQSQMYEENKQWIIKNLNEGAMFLDLGNPNELEIISAFYEAEKSLLFGEIK